MSGKDELVKLELDRQHFMHLAQTLQQKLSESQSREKTLIQQLDNKRPEPEGASNNEQQLNRLKNHLIQIEEQYTQELLELNEKNQFLEEKNQKLQKELILLKRNSQQFRQIETERDAQRSQISLLEDRVQQYSASISNLQLVIEQIQKENERKLSRVESKYQMELEQEKLKTLETLDQLRAQEEQMKESLEALGAASRLSDSIDLKEELISSLKNQAHKKDKTIEELKQTINELKNICETKVDKQVIKGLLIGYFTAQNDRKQDVQRLLARILDFNQQEMEKTGIRIGKQKTTDDSFSHKFVEFLESESKVEKVDKQLAKNLSKSLVISSSINPFISSSSEPMRRSSSNNILIDSDNSDNSVPIFIPKFK